MKKEPLSGNALRQLKREHADAAEQEAAEWKARFDALLARVPVTTLRDGQ